MVYICTLEFSIAVQASWWFNYPGTTDRALCLDCSVFGFNPIQGNSFFLVFPWKEGIVMVVVELSTLGVCVKGKRYGTWLHEYIYMSVHLSVCHLSPRATSWPKIDTNRLNTKWHNTVFKSCGVKTKRTSQYARSGFVSCGDTRSHSRRRGWSPMVPKH